MIYIVLLILFLAIFVPLTILRIKNTKINKKIAQAASRYNDRKSKRNEIFTLQSSLDKIKDNILDIKIEQSGKDEKIANNYSDLLAFKSPSFYGCCLLICKLQNSCENSVINGTLPKEEDRAKLVQITQSNIVKPMKNIIGKCDLLLNSDKKAIKEFTKKYGKIEKIDIANDPILDYEIAMKYEYERLNIQTFLEENFAEDFSDICYGVIKFQDYCLSIIDNSKINLENENDVLILLYRDFISSFDQAIIDTALNESKYSIEYSQKCHNSEFGKQILEKLNEQNEVVHQPSSDELLSLIMKNAFK